MSVYSVPAGLKPLNGGLLTPAATDAGSNSISFAGGTGVLGPVPANALNKKIEGITVNVCLMGAAAFWGRYDRQAAAVGTGILLGTPTATVPILLWLKGEMAIGFRVRSAAGGTWTYVFFADDPL